MFFSFRRQWRCDAEGAAAVRALGAEPSVFLNGQGDDAIGRRSWAPTPSALGVRDNFLTFFQTTRNSLLQYFIFCLFLLK